MRKKPTKKRLKTIFGTQATRTKVVIKPIFSGEASRSMWHEVNGAETLKELRMALYVVCCRIQELESRLTK